MFMIAIQMLLFISIALLSSIGCLYKAYMNMDKDWECYLALFLVINACARYILSNLLRIMDYRKYQEEQKKLKEEKWG
jgi:hypothetical protein